MNRTGYRRENTAAQLDLLSTFDKEMGAPILLHLYLTDSVERRLTACVLAFAHVLTASGMADADPSGAHDGS